MTRRDFHGSFARHPALLLGLALLAPVVARAEDILVPPNVLANPAAIYPKGHTEAANVSLFVTVGLTGHVEKVEVDQTGGKDFDDAASDAVRKWRFSPALRNGEPFTARVKIPFVFVPPVQQPGTAAPGNAAAGATPPAAASPPLATTGSLCAWPDAEKANPAKDLHVIADIHITAAGVPTSVDVTQSPNLNFANAARACAFDLRYQPAHDLLGLPVPGTIRNFDIHFVAPQPPAPPPAVVAIPQPAAAQESEQKPSGPITGVNVRGMRKQPEHGASAFEITVGQLSAIASESPEKLLELAPGIFIANEGGQGHADQVFLRGFDAETGSSIEFTLQGMPLNQVDNPDSHGYADTHFIIPELVENLSVTEGPFNPHQGDFAKAGSVDYQLGVRDRGLLVQNDYGSFNTERILALWAPYKQRDGTFAAAEFESSDGFGSNRSYQFGSAMAQYEGALGTSGLWRLLVTGYAINYKAAGPVSLSDINAGYVSFYGTEDPDDGGNAAHFSVSFNLQSPVAGGLASEQAFVIYNVDQIIEDWTGFLNDPDEFGQTSHPQRGDAIQQNYSAITAGNRGAYRLTGVLLGLSQTLELGYYARYDHTTPSVDLLRYGSNIPYMVDSSSQLPGDLLTDIVNIAGYLNLDIHPIRWLTLRGGIRQEFFSYNVTNECATQGNYEKGEPLDQNCPPYDGTAGGRLPTQQNVASGQITLPKATAMFALPKEFTITGSYGMGAASLPATNISNQENAPFSVINAAEGGLLAHHRWSQVDLSARAIGFYTHVSEDLTFDPSLGRETIAAGTTRAGGVGAIRLTGRWFDELASATYADATYDDSHDLVPYVPEWVVRSDTAVHGVIPWFQLFHHNLVGSLGLELSYIGVRPLPFSQFAPPTFVMDITGSIRWRWIKLGLRVDNLLNSQYPLSEFFYASYFEHTNYATLVPTEAITAAPPRALMFTAAFLLDEDSNR